MFYKNSTMFMLCFLLSSYLKLSAEIIVLKTNADTGNLVAMDPASNEDRTNYVGTTDSSKSIFSIITRYQWPTNLLFADEMNEEERAKLFASTEHAETDFIDKKLREVYHNQTYKAVYVPDTVYQLCVIAYYAEQLQTTDPVSDKLKELASTLSAYFDTFFFKSYPEIGEYIVDLPATFKEFLDACKKPYTDPLVAEVNFLIGCDLGKKIQGRGILTVDAWKSISADFINSILAHHKVFDTLPVSASFQSHDRLDFTRFSEELDGTKLNNGGIVSNLIDVEIKANTTNQALLMNASRPFSQPIGTYAGGKPNRDVLTSTLLFSSVAELAYDDKKDQIKQHATSYGLYPFTGAFYCKYDMPYNYASEKESYFKSGTYFFALKITKGDYYATRCNNLFIIPPFSPLTQLFGCDSMYHALSTVAFKTIPPEGERIEIHGFEKVQDTAGILLIKEDPIKHAQRLASFSAHNAVLLKVPHNKTWEDGLQLLENFTQASKFYSTFSAFSNAAEQIVRKGDLEEVYASLPSGKQKTQIARTAEQALMYYLALIEEHPTPEYMSTILQLRGILGKELPSVINEYVETIATRYINSLTFARNVRLVPHKFLSLSNGVATLSELVSKEQWAILSSLEKQLVHAQETLKTMPVASIWPDIAAGANPSASDKKTSFIKDCTSLSEENAKIKFYFSENPNLRIATYNIHYWTDPHEKNYFDSLSTINRINADVLILQEVAIVKDKYDDYKNMLSEYPYGWESFGNTNNPPTDNLYGNLIISKHPFESAPAVTQFSTNYNTTNDDDDDTSAIRCFINAKIKLPNEKVLSIYGTHLDVFDNTEATRLKQIEELTKVANADKNDYVLIAGDLNSVRKQDYSKPKSFWDLVVAENAKRGAPTPTLVLDHLKETGFVDCFIKIHKPGPTFTSWAGTTIDFIMLRSDWKLPINGCAVYFDATSDHIPVFIDINTSEQATPLGGTAPEEAESEGEESEIEEEGATKPVGYAISKSEESKEALPSSDLENNLIHLSESLKKLNDLLKK